MVAEVGPKSSWNELSEGRGTGSVGCVRWRNKVERAVEKMGGVLEWDVFGPSDVLRREGYGVRFELDAFEVFDDAVGGGAVAMPEGPPSAVWFG